MSDVEAGQDAGGRVAPGEGVTVLLAEDYAELRSVLRRVLEGAGFRVLEAADDAEALALSEAHAGPVRLLVCDLSLRAGGGPALAARLSERRPELRALLIGSEGAGPDPGGLPLLGKPFAPAALLRRLREMLG